jgi:hypothetical protein
MEQFAREAGWGLWPVLLFGAVAVCVAVWHALRPSPRLMPLVIGFASITAVAGVLGSVTGLQHAVEGLGGLPPEQRWIYLIGLKEALNCLVAALVLDCVAALLATLGAFRQACRRGPQATNGRVEALA